MSNTWLNILLLTVTYTGEVEGIEIAASALQAANTAQVIWAFFRLNVVFAELMALEAVGAVVVSEPYEEGRNAVE